jgi:hypothetical protein
MSGGNAGNAGNLQSFGNSGLFDPAANRRKLAEIGGNPLQILWPGIDPLFAVTPERCTPTLNIDIACANCGNSPVRPATTPPQHGCYSAAMTDQALPDQIPDRLSTNPKSPHYNEALLTRGVGIKFDGQEKTNVEEYCVSEGWIRVAVGKTVDRKGNPLTIKLTGKVEPYFQK